MLSLVIPAYNESGRLGKTLATVLSYLHEQPYASEVLVVDDGSTDNTCQVAQHYFDTHAYGEHVTTRVLSYRPNRGKGYAVRQGLLAAQGEIAVFSDADLSTPITELPKVLEPLLANQQDVVFGSRALDYTLVGVKQPWLRERSGRFFNWVMRQATGMPFTDTQCGFKGFRQAAMRPLVEGAVLDRFGFDVELLFLAHRAGLRMLEQSVVWNDAAGSKVGMLSGLDGFRELRQLQRRARKGFYDATLQKTQTIVAGVPVTAAAREE